jgi:hypothetical protein
VSKQLSLACKLITDFHQKSVKMNDFERCLDCSDKCLRASKSNDFTAVPAVYVAVLATVPFPTTFAEIQQSVVVVCGSVVAAQ